MRTSTGFYINTDSRGSARFIEYRLNCLSHSVRFQTNHIWPRFARPPSRPSQRPFKSQPARHTVMWESSIWRMAVHVTRTGDGAVTMNHIGVAYPTLKRRRARVPRQCSECCVLCVPRIDQFRQGVLDQQAKSAVLAKPEPTVPRGRLKLRRFGWNAAKAVQTSHAVYEGGFGHVGYQPNRWAHRSVATGWGHLSLAGERQHEADCEQACDSNVH